MKILVLGDAQHGKDTVADLLRDEHGFKHYSASKVILDDIVWPVLGPLYSSKEEAYADRVNHRATWFDLVKAKLVHQPTYIVEKCLANGDLYCGVRSLTEFKAVRDYFDFILWIDASGRGVPPEPSSSMEIDKSVADFIIYNERDLAYLRGSVASAVDWMLTRRLYDAEYFDGEN